MGTNYFELLGLPQQFAVDEAALRLNYQRCQKAMHPDNFSQASESEQLASVRQGALLNEAYQHLQDPIKRALHLLHLAGFADSFEKYRIDDPDFLMEQMTWRDDLAEIESALDHAGLTQLLKTLRQQIQQRLSWIEDCLNAQQWSQAMAATAKLRFLLRLNEEAERLEDRWLDL